MLSCYRQYDSLKANVPLKVSTGLLLIGLVNHMYQQMFSVVGW